MNTLRLFICRTTTVTEASVMNSRRAAWMRSASCVGRQPRGLHVADERQRDHAVGPDGDVPRHVGLPPDDDAEHVFGADGESRARRALWVPAPRAWRLPGVCAGACCVRWGRRSDSLRGCASVTEHCESEDRGQQGAHGRYPQKNLNIRGRSAAAGVRPRRRRRAGGPCSRKQSTPGTPPAGGRVRRRPCASRRRDAAGPGAGPPRAGDGR